MKRFEQCVFAEYLFPLVQGAGLGAVVLGVSVRWQGLRLPRLE